jgi:hypothetical protein
MSESLDPSRERIALAVESLLCGEAGALERAGAAPEAARRAAARALLAEAEAAWAVHGPPPPLRMPLSPVPLAAGVVLGIALAAFF